MAKPKINFTGSFEYAYKGNWITCTLLKYQSEKDGKIKQYETVGRPFNTDTDAKDYKVISLKDRYGGCDVIATAKCPQFGQKIILLEIVYRIPVQRYVISFPAGFQDKGETDPVKTALRELKEETGYEASYENARYLNQHWTDPWKS